MPIEQGRAPRLTTAGCNVRARNLHVRHRRNATFLVRCFCLTSDALTTQIGIAAVLQMLRALSGASGFVR